MRSVFHWQNDAFQWFDFQTHGFTYQGRNASWQCSATLRKAKKKITTRGLFFSAMSRVKLIAETRVYNMPQKHEIYAFFFFFTVFRKFSRKIQINKFSSGNEEWIESETATITSHYVLSWAFHKLTCRQNKCTAKKRTILIFFFNSKRYRDFS